MQCTLCGEENEYIRIIFTTVECTNETCNNFNQEAMDDWFSSLCSEVEEETEKVEDFDWTTTFLDYTKQ